MKYKVKYNLSHVTSLDMLQREQGVVKNRLRNREQDLKMKMYEIPAELAVAGAKTFIPKILQGKITETALNGGKRLINNFIVPKSGQTDLISGAIRNRSLFSLVKKGLSLFKK